jgi:hypothetical protein
MKRISSHEQGPRHKKNLARHDNEEQANNVDSDSSSESPSIPGPSVNVHLPPNRVLGPLGRTLSQIAKSSTLQQPLYNYPTDSSGVDWDSADYDTQLPDLGTVHMTALAQNFVNYLKDGDIDHDSDDDLEERSQINNSSDSDNGDYLRFFRYDFQLMISHTLMCPMLLVGRLVKSILMQWSLRGFLGLIKRYDYNLENFLSADPSHRHVYLIYFDIFRAVHFPRNRMLRFIGQCSHLVSMIYHRVMIYPFSLLLNNPVSHHSRTIRIIPECPTGLLRWSHLLINPPYY